MSLWRKNVFQRRTPSRTGRRWLRCLAAGLALFGVVAMARAQIEVVALDSDGFVDFQFVQMGGNGTIVFLGGKASGGNPPTYGIYRSSGSGHTLIVQESPTFQRLASPTINDQGQIVYSVWTQVNHEVLPPTPAEYIFLGANTPFDHGLGTTDSPTFALSLNNQKWLALTAGTGELYVTFKASAAIEAPPFQRFGIRIAPFADVHSVTLNNDNQVAYAVSGSVFRLDLVDAPPQPGSAPNIIPEVQTHYLATGFVLITYVTLSDAGNVAFIGRKPEDLIPGNSGLYESSSGGQAQLIESVSPTNSTGFTHLEGASYSPNGTLVVHGTRKKPGPPFYEQGLFRREGGIFEKIVGDGAWVEYEGKIWGIAVVGFLPPKAVSNSGRVVFFGRMGTLDGKDSRFGLFVTSGAPDPPAVQPPGTVYHWKGPSAASPSGSFNVASNWDPEGVPTVNTEKADTAVFSLDSDFAVNGLSPKSERLVILDGTVNLSVGTYEASATSLEEPSVTIGGGGKLNLVGGSLESAHATIGWSAGTQAEAHVFNNGTAWNNQGWLRVGSLSPGHLFVANGAALTTAEMRVADSADGSVVVGGGANMSVESLVVGFNGSGTFEVEAGGQVVVDALRIGNSSSATGLVVVTGVSLADGEPSTITKACPGWAHVGYSGPGELRVEAGGLFELAGSAHMSVGSLPGKGRIFIRGVHPGSGVPSTLAFVTSSPGEATLSVAGFAGNGELAIEDGGRAITGNVVVGAVGSGTARVVGAGINGPSLWTANKIEAGRSGGNGLLEVKAGGLLQVKELGVGVQGSFGGATGEMRIQGRDPTTGMPSTLKFNGNDFDIGRDGSTGLVQVVDGGLVDANVLSLRVGVHGKGQLLVSGFDSASGLNSRLQIDGWSVLVGGPGGVGELVVTNGAWMSAPNVTVGSEGSGAVRVTGSGSGDPSWLSIEDQLAVGIDSGTGVVTVSEGGAITVGSAPPLADTVRIGPGGVLSGIGTIFGNVEMLGGTSDFTGGVVVPGSSPGTLTIQGNLVQHSNSVIVIEVRGTTAGTLHDQIVVTGTADLRGTILLVFQNGYAPRTGHQLRLFDLPGGAPATLPAVQIQNLAPGFNYSLATVGGKLTLTASNNATFVPPATTLRVDGLRVINGMAELSVQSNLDFGSFAVQASSDLQSWANIGQVRIVRGTGRFMDVDAPRFSRLFYRLKNNP